MSVYKPKLYFLTSIMLNVIGIIFIFLINDSRNIYCDLLFLTGFILGFVGISMEMTSYLEGMFNSVVGKGTTLLFYAFSANFAYSYAGQIINNTFSILPSQLLFTQTFIALLMIPALTLLAAFLVLTFLCIYMLIKGQIYKLKGIEGYSYTMFRYWVYGLMLVPISYAVNYIDYNKFLASSALAYSYELESYRLDHCKTNGNEKLIPLDDGYLLIKKNKWDEYELDKFTCMK